MKKILLSIVVLLFFSCKSENEDIVQTIEKDGSVEVELTTNHRNGFDVMTTVQRIWIKNQLIKTLYHNDTIPSLGFSSEWGSDSEGEDTLVTVQKDYQFFITVK